jgi:DNA gyrase subunit A
MYTRNERVVPRDIEDEMRESFTTYAMSVIISRALPDARDGLKPSQRRILVAMRDLNLQPGRGFRKCAKIAGDTSGNYHPHGESVVYPTLVRMAQDFSMRYTLVDGQGNFGSIDGDPPAAMRYTEARLTRPAVVLMEDIEKDTVDYVPNYDGTRTEPTVLPGRFPNLLANGATGIAVGMATNIPPHNIGELAEAIKLYVDDPDVRLKQLMDIMPGPDFPTGGFIVGRKGIKEAYATGRGRLTVRARAGIEPARGGKEYIVVTEIPYMVNKSTLLDNIASLVNNKVITGISDLRDESDRDGMRIVIELKRGEIGRVILNQLYKHTQLQTTFGAIMLALDHGQPRVMALKELFETYVAHRREVIVRRTEHDLRKAEARAHILEGYKLALKHLDEIVALIRKSSNRDEAREKLMAKFTFTEAQANAILDLRLYQLTGLERDKIDEEYKELIKKIARFKSILASEELVRQLIKEDLDEMRNKHGDPRRTDIIEAEGEFDAEDLIPDEACVITISHAGYVKRVPVGTYRAQRRGGKGVAGMATREEDFVEHLFTATTHDYILVFTEQGRCYWLKVYEVPTGGRAARGKAIVNLLNMTSEERIAGLIRVRDLTAEHGILMATERGTIKKTQLAEFSNPRSGGIIAIKIDKGDRLIAVKLTSGHDEVILVTRQGMSVRFPETDARFMGRATRGVRGITLAKKDDAVVGMQIVDPRASLLVVSEKGYGKRTSFDDYRVQSRGGKGIITLRTTDRNGVVVAALSVREADDLMIMTAGGQTIRMPVRDIRVIGRATQGVRLMKIGKDESGQIADRITDVACIVSEETEQPAEPPEATPSEAVDQEPADDEAADEESGEGTEE